MIAIAVSPDVVVVVVDDAPDNCSISDRDHGTPIADRFVACHRIHGIVLSEPMGTQTTTITMMITMTAFAVAVCSFHCSIPVTTIQMTTS